VNRIRTATAALLLTSVVGLQPAPALAQGNDRRDRYEDRWDRRDDRFEYQGRGRGHLKHGEAREARWDAAKHYRKDDRRYRARRLGRNDVVYRGSDNRYYCKRDDGTSGLIIGGLAGGILGNIIAPGGSKTIGTIVGAGAGAVAGKIIDDGEVVCR
jgi:hypothetical protein